MSSVRMCDTCGRVFSEREEGWTTGNMTRLKTVDGIKRQINETVDMCGLCSAAKLDGGPATALMPTAHDSDSAT